MPIAVELDHLVYGVPDLLDGVRRFAAANGVEPVIGGRHAGLGTANYLVGLGSRAYFEIIGPDPDAPDAPPPYLFGLDALAQPRLLTWAVRTEDVDQSVATARKRGYDPGDPIEMSRLADTGDMLTWRLTPHTIDATGGTVPFLIDWGHSRHPSANDLPQLDLAELSMLSPNPDRTVHYLDALGASAPVVRAALAGIRAVLDTPNGTILLT